MTWIVCLEKKIFSKSKMVGILIASFLKVIVYVGDIWMLGKHFDSVANGLSKLSTILDTFSSIVVMIIGLVFILKSAKL